MAKPYNFNVSPLFLVGDRLGVYRDTTFSSSAMHFLQSHEFQIADVYQRGVAYLSRTEATSALEQFSNSEKLRKERPDVILKPDDNEARKFIRNTRMAINSWIEKKEPGGFFNIHGRAGLNGFQRRLIHQLVRNDFPGHRVFTKNDGESMQIERLDPVQEARVQARKGAQFREMVEKQRGLSWIFEALTGGDLSRLNDEWFQYDDDGFPKLTDVAAVKEEIASLQTAFRSKHRVLVGHNLFTDLLFLTKTFVGALPEKVQDFQKIVHDLFPVIIDTKFMATGLGGSKRENSSLDGLWAHFTHQALPRVHLDEKHSLYNQEARSRSHQAGYDSWTTAQLFIKLAAKLDAEFVAADDSRISDSATSVDYITADEGEYEESDDGVPINPPDTNFANPLEMKQPTSSPASTSTTPTRKSRIANPISTSKFSTSNLFANLSDEANGSAEGNESDNDDGGAEVNSSPAKLSTPTHRTIGINRHRHMQSSGRSLIDSDISEDVTTPTLGGHIAPDWDAGLSRYSLGQADGTAAASKSKGMINKFSVETNGHVHSESLRIKQWIPEMTSPFWVAYVDKLRMYGTEEEVCDLRSK